MLSGPVPRGRTEPDPEFEVDPDPDVLPDPEPLVVGGGFTVIVACALFVGSATLVATTVALLLVVTLGAVKTPVLEMEPLLADQVTAVFELLDTWA